MARRTTTTTSNSDGSKTTARSAPRPSSNAVEVRPIAPSQGAPAGMGTLKREPTAAEIRQRAYHIYLARGGRSGSPEADWLQAEQELRAGR